MLTDRRPSPRSALVYPVRVSDAVGWPGAVACSVRPVKPGVPWPSIQARPKSRGATPQIVAASPSWKPLTVLQMSAEAERSSTKNVSVPLPPLRKLEPVPPSNTFVPLLTAIASVPLPLWKNQLGVLTLMFRLSEVT